MVRSGVVLTALLKIRSYPSLYRSVAGLDINLSCVMSLRLAVM